MLQGYLQEQLFHSLYKHQCMIKCAGSLVNISKTLLVTGHSNKKLIQDQLDFL